MSIFDRLTSGLDTLGRKANQALDEGKVRVDLVRIRRRKDNAARDLGYLVYRQTKGATSAEGEVEGLTRRIAEAEAEIERLETRVKEIRAGSKPPSVTPPGPSAPESASGAVPPPSPDPNS
ncbi:MAG: hypothetical protein Q7J79_11815 [Gemmatimonadales bacterium]|nr:hypothetical protein [Gemmatimonadales bacterium]